MCLLKKTSMLKNTSIVTSHQIKKEAYGAFVHEQNNRISHCLIMTTFLMQMCMQQQIFW